MCVSGFVEMELPEELRDGIVMGDVFLRKWYTLFDEQNNSLGFAKAK